MRQCHFIDNRVYVTNILIGTGKKDSKSLACDLLFCISNYKRHVQYEKCLRCCHHACIGIYQKGTVIHCIFVFDESVCSLFTFLYSKLYCLWYKHILTKKLFTSWFFSTKIHQPNDIKPKISNTTCSKRKIQCFVSVISWKNKSPKDQIFHLRNNRYDKIRLIES